MQHPGRFEHLFADPDPLGADRQREPLLDLLLRQLDRIGLDRGEVLVDEFDVLPPRVGAFDEPFLDVAVGGVVEQEALRRLAVAAGAPRLLVIALQRARQVVVDDEPHVALVDPHPEGGGGDDDLGAALHERILGRLAIVGHQARVVGHDPPPEPPGRHLGDLLRPLARRGIDDPRARRLLEEFDQPLGLLALAPRDPDAVEEILPRETANERLGVRQAELCDDVAPDRVRRRRRQGDRRRVAAQPAEASQPGVVGAEIVAPLADAMRLVDRQQAQPRAPDCLQEPAAAEPFRHHVDDPHLAAGDRIQAALLLARAERAVDVRDRQAQAAELVDLVLHQRDQRRDDQRQPVEHQRRQLVAEALASAGRHYAQAIATRQHGADHLFLAEPEAGQPESAQIGFDPGGFGSGHRQRAGREGC